MSSLTRSLSLSCLVFTLLLVAGCAPENIRKSPLDILSVLEQTPSRDPALLDRIDILALNKDAREFIDSRVGGIKEPYEKVRALRRAVFDKNGLNYSLDNDLTLTASEAFEMAGGNCVALANFFVAAVRYLGIDAVFQEVERESVTDSDNLRLVARHINVSGELIWSNRKARYVLDYLSVPEEDFNRSKVISDQRAFAHYYNNLAVEYLLKNDIETALQYLKIAVHNDIDADFAWSNLGVSYSHRGDYHAAEYSYQRAINLNRDNRSARKNLDSLYERWTN